MMVRRLNFHSRLRQLMAAHEIWKTTELIPLLAERGVEPVDRAGHRLVTDKPERLSMKTLVALGESWPAPRPTSIDPYVETAARRPAAGEATDAEHHRDAPRDLRPDGPGSSTKTGEHRKRSRLDTDRPSGTGSYRGVGPAPVAALCAVRGLLLDRVALARGPDLPILPHQRPPTRRPLQRLRA